MMSRKQLLLVWAVLSLVCSGLYVASNPQALTEEFAWKCVGYYLCFSAVVFVLVEVGGTLVSNYMVPPIDPDFRVLPRGATIHLPACRIIASPSGIPLLAGDDDELVS